MQQKNQTLTTVIVAAVVAILSAGGTYCFMKYQQKPATEPEKQIVKTGKFEELEKFCKTKLGSQAQVKTYVANANGEFGSCGLGEMGAAHIMKKAGNGWKELFATQNLTAEQKALVETEKVPSEIIAEPRA